MADTRRSLTNLQTLLADNAAGAISAQDIRDFLVSTSPARGSCYISSALETTIAAVDTWTKALGTTTSIGLTEFTMPASNRLTYTGTDDLWCHVTCCLSASSTVAAKGFEYGIYRYDNSGASGAMVGHSTISHYHSDTSTEAVTVQAWLTMSTSDYIELHVQNVTDGEEVTIDYMTLGIQGIVS